MQYITLINSLNPYFVFNTWDCTYWAFLHFFTLLKALNPFCSPEYFFPLLALFTICSVLWGLSSPEIQQHFGHLVKHLKQEQSIKTIFFFWISATPLRFFHTQIENVHMETQLLLHSAFSQICDQVNLDRHLLAIWSLNAGGMGTCFQQGY